MSMRRRGFLRMLGAAIAAPAMPLTASAGGYSRSAFKVALAHAQRFPVVSVAGLAKRGGLSIDQAEAMIRELARQDMVRLVGPSVSGKPRAASKILVNDPWGIARTSQDRAAARMERQPQQEDADLNASETVENDEKPHAHTPLWIAHLHELCRSQGMPLSPRCFA